MSSPAFATATAAAPAPAATAGAGPVTATATSNSRPFLDLAAAIERSTLSRSAIFRAVRTGRLRAHRPPGIRRLIFAVEDLDAFVRGEQAPSTGAAAG